MRPYQTTNGAETGQQRRSSGVEFPGKTPKFGDFPDKATGAFVSDEPAWRELSSPAVKPKPEKGRETGPQRIGELIPEVLKNIQNRAKRQKEKSCSTIYN